MTDQPELSIDRTFNAPRPLVWRAWTDPTLLARWYGPGVETIIHGFDLKPGGEWRNEMKFGDKSMLSKMVFTEVTPEARLVWRHSDADKDWNIIPSPMMPDWPLVLHTVVTFTDNGATTNVRLTQTPIDATPEQIAAFAQMAPNMSGGWDKGFAIIDDILSELSNA